MTDKLKDKIVKLGLLETFKNRCDLKYQDLNVEITGITSLTVEGALEELASSITGNEITAEKLTVSNSGKLATYRLSKGGSLLIDIDIPKDYVNNIIGVVSKDGNNNDGVFLKVNVAPTGESASYEYVDVSNLVEYLTVPSAASQTGPIVLSISNNHVLTGDINDGSITKSKLTSNAQEVLDNAEEITYSNLVSLKNNSQLVPGKWYRITDYVTTTAQADTQSANHSFDVVVLATGVNTLNENAKAAIHSDDTYFSGCKLESWELKYCLDNDTDRFAWADTTNGKGVIYRMIDEFNNECPYDFKNIQYVFTQGFTVKYQTHGLRIKIYGRNSDADQTIDGTTYYSWTKIAELSSGGENLPDNYWTTTTTLTTSMDRYIISEGVATKNTSGNIEQVINQSFTTFTFEQQGNDASISGGSNKVFDNKITSYIPDNGKITLNAIYFRYTSSGFLTAYGNVFNSNCHDMNFSNSCYENSFGNNCYNNSFGNYCQYNSFGNYCGSNSFGNSCSNNSFGNYCSNNSFGNYCGSNSFGNSCNYNSFGSNCQNNSFGNRCNSNSFGDSCQQNSFENSCQQNSFGANCYSNSFGNSCQGNSFGTNCYSNSFGNECNHIRFLKNYSYYNIVEDGNQYIDVTSTQATSQSQLLRNIMISQGVNTDGTSSNKKIISHNTINNNFQTVYKSTNSVEVSV